MEFVTAAIAIGSNVGDREAHLHAAVAALGQLSETSVLSVSAFHETDPVGPIAQGMFLNAAALVRTRMSAQELLNAMHAIEASRGRNREAEQRWGPRTLDLDLLLYGEQMVREPGLWVPHPRMVERAFVLVPLAEIAASMVIPGTGLSVGQALEALQR